MCWTQLNRELPHDHVQHAFDSLQTQLVAVAGQQLVQRSDHLALLAPKLELPAHPKVCEELQFLDQACAYR